MTSDQPRKCPLELLPLFSPRERVSEGSAQKARMNHIALLPLPALRERIAAEVLMNASERDPGKRLIESYGLKLADHTDITAEILKMMNGRGEEWPWVE
jgi:hypothetical protein